MSTQTIKKREHNPTKTSNRWVHIYVEAYRESLFCFALPIKVILIRSNQGKIHTATLISKQWLSSSKHPVCVAKLKLPKHEKLKQIGIIFCSKTNVFSGTKQVATARLKYSTCIPVPPNINEETYKEVTYENVFLKWDVAKSLNQSLGLTYIKPRFKLVNKVKEKSFSLLRLNLGTPAQVRIVNHQTGLSVKHHTNNSGKIELKINTHGIFTIMLALLDKGKRLLSKPIGFYKIMHISKGKEYYLDLSSCKPYG